MKKKIYCVFVALMIAIIAAVNMEKSSETNSFVDSRLSNTEALANYEGYEGYNPCIVGVPDYENGVNKLLWCGTCSYDLFYLFSGDGYCQI